MKILKLLLNFVIATLLTSILSFSGLFMPILIIFSVATQTAMSVKFSWVYSLLSSAFAGILTFFITGSEIISILFPLLVLVSSLGIYIALKHKRDIKTTLFAGTTGYFALILIAYLLYGGSFVADIVDMAKTVMFESLDSISASVPAGSESAIGDIRQMYELYFENLKIMAPSIILSLFFLISYFSIKMSSHFVKDKSDFVNIPAFSELRAPAFLLIIGAISYFGQLAENTFVSGLLANVFMAVSVYYTLCGFSLIDFFTKLRIKSLAARIAIYLFGIFLLSALSVVIYFANPILIAMFGGAIDSIVNYRAKIKVFKGK